MAEDFQNERGALSCGDEQIQDATPATGWSVRWPGRPDPACVELPRVARRKIGQLVTTIEGEVIPRLILSQRARATEIHTDVAPLSHAGEECVAEFVNLLLTHQLEVAYAYIDSVRVRGVTLAAIYLELLAPAAKVLGEMWEDDRCSFADVTVALCRLHEILRCLSGRENVDTDTPPVGRRVLLAPAPGEQHTFGLLMVADFFRRSGWEVWSESPKTSTDLLGLAGHEWFTLVGLSVGCESRLEGVASTIHAVRKVARNRSVGVMVGGALFSKRPELAVQVGADATGTDARQAALQAENLVTMLARRC